MTETDQDPSTDEGTDVMVRRERLDEGRDDCEEAADPHAPAPPEKVGEGPADEPSRDDGADGVGGVDEAEHVRILFLFADLCLAPAPWTAICSHLSSRQTGWKGAYQVDVEPLEPVF